MGIEARRQERLVRRTTATLLILTVAVPLLMLAWLGGYL